MPKSVNLIAFFKGWSGGGDRDSLLTVESWHCNLFEFRLAKYLNTNIFLLPSILSFFAVAAAKFLGHAGNAETRNAPEFRTISLRGVRRGARLQYRLRVGDNDRCG